MLFIIFYLNFNSFLCDKNNNNFTQQISCSLFKLKSQPLSLLQIYFNYFSPFNIFSKVHLFFGKQLMQHLDLNLPLKLNPNRWGMLAIKDVTLLLSGWMRPLYILQKVKNSPLLDKARSVKICLRPLQV